MEDIQKVVTEDDGLNWVLKKISSLGNEERKLFTQKDRREEK